jgi:hypothetical protein
MSSIIYVVEWIIADVFEMMYGPPTTELFKHRKIFLNRDHAEQFKKDLIEKARLFGLKNFSPTIQEEPLTEFP